MIEGQKVNLIEPFPAENLRELHGWLGAARAISGTEEFPRDFAQFEARMLATLPKIRSWGVIDKADGAVIGVVMFEPVGLMGGQSYVASARRAWGRGLMDEAARLGIRQVFTDDPRAGYIFGFVLASNAPAKSFNERIGMRLKNILPAHTLQDGKPRDMWIFETTREQWERREQPPTPAA